MMRELTYRAVSYPEEFWFLRQAVKSLDPKNPGWIWAFNDACETKHQDVLHVFDLGYSWSMRKCLHRQSLVRGSDMPKRGYGMSVAMKFLSALVTLTLMELPAFQTLRGLSLRRNRGRVSKQFTMNQPVERFLSLNELLKACAIATADTPKLITSKGEKMTTVPRYRSVQPPITADGDILKKNPSASIGELNGCIVKMRYSGEIRDNLISW